MTRIDYELIRSKRKTIAIHIKDCRVIVRAPIRYPAREIDRFVELKRDWIEKHLLVQKERMQQTLAFKLDYGCEVLYLGHKYKIASTEGIKDTFYCPPGLDETQIRKRLVLFYKERASEIIQGLIALSAPRIGVSPAGVRIGSAKRSWGSCSSSGKLTFSWRLMMATPEAIEYVVVHELAHLKQLNHSKAFWEIVSSLIPNWKECRKELHLLQARSQL